MVFTGDITQFQVPPGDSLADAGTRYDWRVIARDLALNTASSVVGTFTVDTVPPGAVDLVDPSEGAVLSGEAATPLLFKWSKSPTTGDIEDYLLQVVRSGDDFDTGPFALEAMVTHPTTQFKVPLGSGLPDDNYRWRVLARDKALNTTGSRETRSFEIRIQQVDLRLEPDSDIVGFGHSFDVSIVVSATIDQPVDTVSAFLEFNNGDLEVVEIRSGDVLADLIESSFDNARGTVDFSAITFGKPPTGDFVLAVVTFRSINSGGTPASTIRFSTGDTDASARRTEAAFRASSVLRETVPVSVELSGLKVDIALETEGTVFSTNAIIPVAITVKPNGQAVDTVQAFLSFNTGDLELLSIEPGDVLVDLIKSMSGDGTVDFSALTFGKAPTGDFVLAVVTFRAKEPANLAEQVTTADLISTLLKRTDADYKGASVLRKLVPAKLTILKPFVDILLGLDTGDGQTRFADFGGFAFTRGTEFDVVIRVEPNGQSVSAVDALLDFDPETLEVLGITRTGDILPDQVTLSRFDNVAGTIEFSALTTTGIFSTGDIAIVTFKARQATQSLNVGFHEEDVRRTEAAFQGASVLRKLIGFPVEVVLEPRLSGSVGNFNVDLLIVVRPNGNRVSTVSAFLDFNAGALVSGDLISIRSGDVLADVITGDFDNVTGTADFSATNFRPPATTKFVLATVNLLFTGDRDDLAKVGVMFHREFPRKTEVAFRDVPAANLRLVDLISLELVLPGAPENLQPLDSIFDATFKPESTEGRPWGQPLKKLEGAPVNLG